MLSYTVEPEKQDGLVAPSNGNKKREKSWPKITVPVSPEIVAALEMDGDCEICLIGKVTGLRSNQGGWEGDRTEVTIELREVEVYEGEERPGDDGEEPDSMEAAISRELDSPARQKARAARKE